MFGEFGGIVYQPTELNAFAHRSILGKGEWMAYQAFTLCIEISLVPRWLLRARERVTVARAWVLLSAPG